MKHSQCPTEEQQMFREQFYELVKTHTPKEIAHLTGYNYYYVLMKIKKPSSKIAPFLKLKRHR